MPTPLDAPSHGAASEHTVAHRRLLVVATLFFALSVGSACATSGSASDAAGGEAGADWSRSQLERFERLEEHLRGSPPAQGAANLRIQLAFDDAADLDLYVTDPLQETVYFANTRSRSSGRARGPHGNRETLS